MGISFYKPVSEQCTYCTTSRLRDSHQTDAEQLSMLATPSTPEQQGPGPVLVHDGFQLGGPKKTGISFLLGYCKEIYLFLCSLTKLRLPFPNPFPTMWKLYLIDHTFSLNKENGLPFPDRYIVIVSFWAILRAFVCFNANMRNK